MMSFHTTFTCSEGLIRDAFERAADLEVLCHAHVNEGVHEPRWCEEHLGMRTVEYYDRLGVASHRFLASQCVQLSSAERRIIAERGVRCSHMPLSNCEVGGGIAPVPEQLAAGVTIGLGTDGYITDMFEVMRGAFLIHKARLLDPATMPAATVLGMATEGSARAIGLDHVGRLDPGWKADLVVVDADLPTPLTEDNLFDQVVLWRNRSHVRQVMVDGNWRVRDGQVDGVDRERLRARVGEQAERLWVRT
jgi:cytosine/adenosine deaminase-related metal-dependent hydrolase